MTVEEKYYLPPFPRSPRRFAGGLFLEAESTSLDIIFSFRQEALRKDMIKMNAWKFKKNKITNKRREKISLWSYPIFSLLPSFLFFLSSLSLPASLLPLFPPSIFVLCLLPSLFLLPSFLGYSLKSLPHARVSVGCRGYSSKIDITAPLIEFKD